MQLGNRCKHGLYCSCFICDYEKMIEMLTTENKQLKEELKVLKDFDPTE